MEVIPAVDIKGGVVVRLLRGDPEFSTSYSTLGDPLSISRKWINEGAKTLHVIDLDAALGTGSNLPLVEEMVKSLEVDFQVGGGIRSFDLAQKLLKIGAKRIIVGTLAFANGKDFMRLLDTFGKDRVIVSLDHHGKEVMLEGWKVASHIDIHRAMKEFLGRGVDLFLVTSVDRDGTLTSPDFEVLSEICKKKEAKIIAAGGVSNLEQLVIAKSLGAHAVVIGKALYEEKIDLREAINVMKEGSI